MLEYAPQFALSLLASAGVSVALTTVLIWLTREWMSNRIKSSIQHEYDLQLESHKNQLKADQEFALLELRTTIEKEAILQSVANTTLTEVQKAATERKLDATEELWKRVIELRNMLPPIVTFLDVLTIDEFSSASAHPTFVQLSEGLEVENLSATYGQVSQGIEHTRPYVGEYIWAVFYSYQAVMVRIFFLMHQAREDPTKVEWFKDLGNLQLLGAVLSQTEMKEFDEQRFGKIAWVQRILERKILLSMSNLISGRETSEESLRQAHEIQNKVSEVVMKARGGAA